MRSAAPPLRGALIGCGFVSQFHLEAWSRVPDARLVALCDMDRERLERAGRTSPGGAVLHRCRPCCSSRGGPRLSSRSARSPNRIASWSSWRHVAALHILCQKPAALVRVGLSGDDRRLRSAGVRLMIHENWRFRPWYRAMRAEIDAGSIGRPIRLRIAHRDTRALRPDGFATQPYLATMPRLILMDMGCHLVDTARYLIGEIQTVSATIGRFGQRQCRRGRGDAVGLLRRAVPSACST